MPNQGISPLFSISGGIGFLDLNQKIAAPSFEPVRQPPKPHEGTAG